MYYCGGGDIRNNAMRVVWIIMYRIIQGTNPWLLLQENMVNSDRKHYKFFLDNKE
jgi:hypothetical protein